MKKVLIGAAALTIACMALLMSGAPDASGRVVVDQPAISFTLPDINGKNVSLSDFKGKYVILEWINYDCPFVQKHYNSGNMQALQKKYMDKGVVWLAICSSKPGSQGHFVTAEIQSRMKKHNSTISAYLIDAEGKVGRDYGATNTPHMYIIDAQGKLVYMGAIDDKPTANIADVAKAQNYVTMTMDAVMTGKDIAVKSTKAYGCSVKY